MAMSLSTLLHDEFGSKRSSVAALCKTYGVASLDVFGSATSEDWEHARSDLDFLVRFLPDSDQHLADRYLGLAEDLEKLFGRRVDLVTEGAIRNPYFRRNVEATRISIYAG
jgi:predicted nucleotidyltransferase